MSIVDLAMNLTGWIESLMFFMLFDAFMERRIPFSPWRYRTGILLLGSLIWLVNHYFLYRFSNYTGIILIAIIISFYFYNGTITTRILTSIFAITIMVAVEMGVLYSIAFIFGISIEDAVQIPSYLLLGIIVSKTLGLMICDAIRVKSRMRDFELGKIYWLLFVALFTSVMLVVFILFWMTYKLNDFTYNTMAGICSFVLIFCSFFVLYLYERFARQSLELQRKAQYEQQHKGQLKHVDEIIVQQTEVRRLKHDMTNQLLAIDGYMDQGDLAGGKHYVRSLIDQLQAIGTSINTGNIALDAILNAKKEVAQSKGIAFTTSLRIADRLSIAPDDLCVIFGNALDNALEACAQLPQDADKTITLTLVQDATSLFCKITNTALPPQHNNWRTTKADPINHGFGMRNIREALENYNVTPEFSWKDGLFTFQFALCH